MFLPKLSSALVVALALSGAALVADVPGTYAQQTLQRSVLPENPARPNCSTNPYDPNFQLGGCGGGEVLALVERATPQVAPLPLCDFLDARDNPYCSNYSPDDE